MMWLNKMLNESMMVPKHQRFNYAPGGDWPSAILYSDIGTYGILELDKPFQDQREGEAFPTWKVFIHTKNWKGTPRFKDEKSATAFYNYIKNMNVGHRMNESIAADFRKALNENAVN